MEYPTTRELAEDHPELVTDEAPDGVSSTPSPPVTNEEFEQRVSRLMELMAENPTNRDRIIAEIYVNMASAEMGIRGVFEAVQSQGIAGLMKGALRRNK
jgi:hypothetical protein